MKKESLEQENQRLKATIADLRRKSNVAERRASRAKVSVNALREEKKKLKSDLRKIMTSNEILDSLLENICAAIEDFDKKTEPMSYMQGAKVIKYIRSKLIDRLMLSGASIIKNDRTFDLLRHNPIEFSENTEEGCKITETIQPGIEYGGKVYLRAIVKLENV